MHQTLISRRTAEESAGYRLARRCSPRATRTARAEIPDRLEPAASLIEPRPGQGQAIRQLSHLSAEFPGAGELGRGIVGTPAHFGEPPPRLLVLLPLDAQELLSGLVLQPGLVEVRPDVVEALIRVAGIRQPFEHVAVGRLDPTGRGRRD